MPPLPPRLIAALACPDDGGAVSSGQDGIPTCRRCNRVFSVHGRIVTMLPSDSSWGEASTADVIAERAQRDLEAPKYDRLLGLRLLSAWEIPATLRPLHVGATDRVLDVGCGTGRFSVQIAGACRELIAVDHSFDSLRILERKLSITRSESTLLVQGDATRLPIQSGWATRAVSCQMLEHLPADEMRRRAISELARALAREGRLALSAYWHTPGLRWLIKREGRHSGTIYFHRFEMEELRAMLQSEFEVEALTGRLVYVLLAHARRR